MLHVQPTEPGRLVRSDDLRFGLSCERQQVIQMGAADCRDFAGLDEPVSRVLPDRLEEPVPPLRARLVYDDQRLVYEPGQQVEDVAVIYAAAGTHLLGRFERPSTRKHRQPAEQSAFAVREQLVTPVHRGFEGTLPGDRRPPAAGEQPETIVEPVTDLSDREELHAGGGQLDGQWHTVQPPADVCHRP